MMADTVFCYHLALLQLATRDQLLFSLIQFNTVLMLNVKIKFGVQRANLSRQNVDAS